MQAMTEIAGAHPFSATGAGCMRAPRFVRSSESDLPIAIATVSVASRHPPPRRTTVSKVKPGGR